MAANLSSPPLNGERWQMADWIEFKALCDEFSICRINNIVRIQDENQEFENSDFLAQDAINEQLLAKVTEELVTRAKSLGKSYPFDFEDNQSLLVLKSDENLTNGCYAYLYCLFFSHINSTQVITEEPPVNNVTRDYMQICATIAAAGIVQGNAISFGFPRPDQSNFLTALHSTYRRIGEGEVRQTPLRAAPIHTKDGEIDVIAWQHTPDNTPGIHYLLAQVASGNDWASKSVKGAVETFHKMWFSVQPPSSHRPAMFIPFCIDLKPAPKSKDEYLLADAITALMFKFGDIFYRYNVPAYVDKGFNLLQEDSSLYIERHEHFQQVINYVNDFRQTLASNE